MQSKSHELEKVQNVAAAVAGSIRRKRDGSFFLLSKEQEKRTVYDSSTFVL